MVFNKKNYFIMFFYLFVPAYFCEGKTDSDVTFLADDIRYKE